MRPLEVGDQVADLQLLRPDGSSVRLSDFRGPLVLIFIRHLH
jgi:peroxiredoxin